jgi:hypothetical protein
MFLLWSTLVRWMLSERWMYCCELQRDMPFACHLSPDLRPVPIGNVQTVSEEMKTTDAQFER